MAETGTLGITADFAADFGSLYSAIGGVDIGPSLSIAGFAIGGGDGGAAPMPSEP